MLIGDNRVILTEGATLVYLAGLLSLVRPIYLSTLSLLLAAVVGYVPAVYMSLLTMKMEYVRYGRTREEGVYCTAVVAVVRPFFF